MEYLFHLFQGEGFMPELKPASLDSEGFVHLSTADQVLRTAQRWFAQASDLKLLILDYSKIKAKVVWEDTHQHGEDFPHLYGPIPEEAIHGVCRLERDSKGTYQWPHSLASLRSPLLEKLTSEVALIEPSKRFPEKKLPELCLLCFFQDCLDELRDLENCQILDGLGSEIGATEVFVLTQNGNEVVVCHPGVGGPLAAATLEELIVLGCRQFLVCGGAGSLLPEQTLGHLVLTTEAIRDEGLSHHYLRPEQTVAVCETWFTTIRERIEARKVAFTSGKSWTTDALYRETPSRIEKRKAQGCLTVEMELASLLAVAQFRQVELAALLYCGDDLSTEEWDFRDWTKASSVRQKLFSLGLEILSN